MYDIEKQGRSEFGQFGAFTIEQQAMVNAFEKMVGKGRIPVPSGAPRHNEGDVPQGDCGNVESTQVEVLGDPIDHGMETKSLKVRFQHLHSLTRHSINHTTQKIDEYWIKLQFGKPCAY